MRNRRRPNLEFEPLENRQLLAVRVWDGGGSDNLWTTAENWSTNVAPVANDDLTFPTSGVRYSPVNDFTNTTFGTITFGDYGYTVTGNPLSLTGGLVSTFSGAVASSLDTDITLLSDITVSITGGGLGLGGTIDDGAGTYGLTKTGGGSLGLSGSNTYDGTTTISSGAISISSDQALGSTTGNTVVNGGSLYVLGGSPRTVAENISLTGAGSGSAILFGLNGDSTLTGNITIANHPGINALNGSTLTLSGTIDDSVGTSALTLSSDSTSKVVVGGTNLYDGVTTISTGLVNITAAGALGDVATSTTTTVSTGASLEISGGISLPSTKAIRLNGTALSGLSKLISRSGDNVIAGGVRLGSNQTFEVAADSLTISGVISQDDPFNLTKAGAGLLTLGGTNSYSGTTTVNAGTLLVNGTVAGSVALAGGTLAGSGTISGAGLTTSGTPTIEPGPIGGVGILAYSGSSGATLASGTTLKIEINGSTVGTGYDQLNLTNASALFNPNGADLDVQLGLGYLPTVNTTFQIVSQANSTAVSGRFNGIAQSGSYTSGSVTFSVGYFASGVILTVTAVNVPTFTWDGGDVDDSLWSSPDNWVGNVAPTPGVKLLFPSGALRKANTNDFAADTNFNDITIEDSGYVLGGNSIDLDGDLITTYATGNSVITADIVLQSSRTISVASGGALSLASSVSGGFGLTKNGAGTLRIVGTTANTYTGATTVNAGTLVLSKTNNVDAIAGLLVIGDNTGDQLLRLEGSGQIADSADLTINEGATFDLNGQSESIDELTMRGATVQIPTGSTFGVIGQITTNVTTTDVTSSIEGLGTLALENASNTDLGITVADDADLDIELRISAAISGSGRGLNKLGAGTLALAAALSTYDGSTIADAGIIQIESDGALGNTDAAEVHSGASFHFAGTNLNIAKSFSIASGAGFLGGAALYVVSGSTTISGGISLLGNGKIGAEDGQSLTVTGAIDDGSDAYHLTITNGATGRTTLGGNNGFDGDLTVTEGLLRLVHSGAAGDASATTNVMIEDGATLELSGGIATPAGKSLNLAGATATGSAKVVNLAGDNAIGGPIFLLTNAEFDVAEGTLLSLGGDMSDGGMLLGISKQGLGTLDLLGGGTYSDTTLVNAGKVLVNNDYGSSPFEVADGATIGGLGVVGNLVVYGGGTLSPGNSPSAFYSQNLSLATGSTFIAELPGDLVEVTGTVNLDSDSMGGATLSLVFLATPGVGDVLTLINNDGNDAVIGTFLGRPEGSIITFGAATFTLSYVGGDGNDVVLTATDVSYTWDGGDIDDSLWSSPDNWVGNVSPTENARLIFPSGAMRLSNLNDFAADFDVYAIVVGAAGYTLSGNAIDLSSGISATFGSGSSTLDMDIALKATQTFSVAAGGTLFANGAISGAGFGVTKTGAGTLQYAGTVANTYSGTTNVVEGTLELNRLESVTSVQGGLVVGDNIGTGATVRVMVTDQIANTQDVTVNEGATFKLDGGVTEDFMTLTMQGATVDLAAGSVLNPFSGLSTLATTNNVTSNIQGDGSFMLTGTYAVDVADDPSVDVDLRISANLINPVANTGALAKSGLGTVALSGNNTYTGLTTITQGAILVESETALGTADGLTSVASGASVLFAGGVFTIAEDFEIAGTGLASAGAMAVVSGSTTLTGGITLKVDATITTDENTTLTVDGVIGGSFRLDKKGAGTLALSAANTYSGQTTIAEGVVAISNGLALGSGPLSLFGELQLSGDINVTNPAVIASTGIAFRNVGGDNTMTGILFALGTRTIDVAAGTSLRLSGAIYDNIVGDPSGIRKLGAGALSLTGTSQYTGQTTVEDGTLLVDGSIATGSNVVVSNGATLGGTGVVPAVSVASQSGIMPGVEGAGTLFTGDLDMALESYYAMDLKGIIAGVEYDQLDVTGTVMLSGPALTLAIDNFLATSGQEFRIINNDGTDAVVGTFANLPEGAIVVVDGQPFSISYVGGSGNDVVLTSVAIELTPSTLDSPTAGSVYSQQLIATGGSGSGYVFTATGLPAGLSISSSGLITGTPTTANATPVEVSVTVVDSLGATSTAIYLMSVNVAITVSPGVLQTPTLGSPFSQQLTATGGSGIGYTFSATGLPAGLSIDSNGLITGIATSATPATVLVTVTDGDGASTLVTYNVTAAAAPTTTGLEISPASTLYGQTITLTATVVSAATEIAAPSGTVRFFNGDILIGTGTVGLDGRATITTTGLGVGTQTITAIYDGDANYSLSTSAAQSQTVGQAGSSSSLAASTLTPGLNQPLTFTATVAGQFGGTVSGTVSFFDGSTLLGTATTNEQGVATFVTSSLTIGEHTITAVYNGDANLAGSTAPGIVVTISQAQTNAGIVTSSAPQIFYGQDVTLTASFSAPSINGAPMTGTVMFFDGDTYLGVANLVATPNGSLATASVGTLQASVRILIGTASGQAQLATTGLAVGDHVIRAVYSGDANYSAASSETPVSVQVDPATTTTTLNVATSPTSTVLTATVVVTSPGNPPVVGSVSFFAGTTLLATVPVVNGVATYDAGVLSPGVQALSAVFSGDGTSSGSNSTVTVSTSGPRVIGLSRFGIHRQRTSLVLNFDSALDMARAQNVANYRLTDSAGRRIAVARAVYNPANLTVTLTPSSNLSLYKVYSLTVIGTGPNGLTGASGTALDGSGTNQSGTNFTAQISWKTLDIPGNSPAMKFQNGQVTTVQGKMQRYLRMVTHAARTIVRPASPRIARSR